MGKLISLEFLEFLKVRLEIPGIPGIQEFLCLDAPRLLGL